MGKMKYSISLDMHSSVSQASLAAKQGDDNRQFNITLRSGGQPYKIERGALAVFSTTLPDGKTVIEDNCIIVGDEITYDFTQNLTSQVGVLDIEIRLYDRNSKLITSPTFVLVVSPRAAKGEIITSSNSFTALDTLYKDTKELKKTVQNKLDNGEFKGDKGDKGDSVNYDQVAPVIRNTVKGTTVIITDISPIEQTLKVKTKGIADVLMYGKNLFNLKNNGRSVEMFESVVAVPNQAYTLSANELFEGVYLMNGTADGPTFGRQLISDEALHNLTFKIDGNKVYTGDNFENVVEFEYPIEKFMLTVYSHDISGWSSTPLVQLEYGPTPTEYEPPVITVHTIPMGVDYLKIPSVYPVTMLMSDAEGVELEVEYNVDTKKYVDKAFTEIDLAKAKLRIIENTISKPFTEKDIDPVFGNNPWELVQLVCQYGNPSKYWKARDYKLLEFNGGNYPMQILGFNHDKATDPYAYGKKKTGMTLMLGASRNVYGDGASSLYTKSIEGLMDDRGYFKAPNRVLKDYTDGATNWAESGFRLALQTLFDETEIANYIVPVQKYTSRYYKKNIYWSDALITNDKVFLPSEYEIFGQQILAPYIEGEQYEFFKDGYSKFMWSDALLMGDSDLGRLWLRSAYGAKVNELQGDSNYSLNVYLGVNSRNPVNVLYSPSYANVGDGVIAPCICL